MKSLKISFEVKKVYNAGFVAEVLQAEIAPISDARGSATYKRLLLRQLFFAHFLTLFPNTLTAEILL